ncbi:MAG: YoaK family protein, partial [Anaerorhabdus sp.]
MKHSTQVSDSLGLGLLLTLSGGFMDAYSYLFRGKVFANAQTGNILLLGINIFEGQWENTIKYLIPIIAFSIGIAIAE